MRFLVPSLLLALACFVSVEAACRSTTTVVVDPAMGASISMVGYNNSIDVCWLVTTNNRGNVILRVNSFYTEQNFDFVYVYQGSTSSSGVYASWSGTINPQTITLPSSSILIEFRTDASITRSGFNFAFSTSQTPSTTVACPTLAYLTTPGNITMGRYGNNQHCRWQISTTDRNIVVQVNWINTESCCDHLVISGQSGNVVARLQGISSQPQIFVVDSQTATIQFDTDASVVGNGFSLSFTGGNTAPPPVNECGTGLHNCHYYANCTDLPVGYNCTCNTGYVGTGTTCSVYGACSTGAHACDRNAFCTQITSTRYTCSCNYGYTGNGYYCSLLSSCSNGLVTCGANARCVGNTCVCNTGYNGDGYSCGMGCSLSSGRCGANAYCYNTMYGTSCLCMSGYYGDGYTCTRSSSPSSSSSRSNVLAWVFGVLGSVFAILFIFIFFIWFVRYRMNARAAVASVPTGIQLAPMGGAGGVELAMPAQGVPVAPYPMPYPQNAYMPTTFPATTMAGAGMGQPTMMQGGAGQIGFVNAMPTMRASFGVPAHDPAAVGGGYGQMVIVQLPDGSTAACPVVQMMPPTQLAAPAPAATTSDISGHHYGGAAASGMDHHAAKQQHQEEQQSRSRASSFAAGGGGSAAEHQFEHEPFEDEEDREQTEAMNASLLRHAA